YCHVYVTANGLDVLRSGEGTYPVGTWIVKAKYADQGTSKIELFTRMRKMPAGYDPDHGDWEYAVIDRDRVTVLAQGTLANCIACHDAHKATDYVTRVYLK